MSTQSLDHTSPAETGWFTRWLHRYAQRRAMHRQQRIKRAAFRNMLRLDDNLLKDIGVTCGDLIWASQLPLSQDAAQELHPTSARNRNSH